MYSEYLIDGLLIYGDPLRERCFFFFLRTSYFLRYARTSYDTIRARSYHIVIIFFITGLFLLLLSVTLIFSQLLYAGLLERELHRSLWHFKQKPWPPEMSTLISLIPSLALTTFGSLSFIGFAIPI